MIKLFNIGEIAWAVDKLLNKKYKNIYSNKHVDSSND